MIKKFTAIILCLGLSAVVVARIAVITDGNPIHIILASVIGVAGSIWVTSQV